TKRIALPPPRLDLWRCYPQTAEFAVRYKQCTLPHTLHTGGGVMLKVLVASSKGGAGKSTIATNLAAHYAVKGHNTVLVDADRQGSSLRWSEKRAAHANAVLGIPGLRRDWERHVPADAERVIIDSAAGIRASEVADYLDGIDAVVVPVLPSAIDLEATAPFLAEIAELPRIKRGKVAVGIVANRLKPW